jgi:hypothetical protein
VTSTASATAATLAFTNILARPGRASVQLRIRSLMLRGDATGGNPQRIAMKLPSTRLVAPSTAITAPRT